MLHGRGAGPENILDLVPALARPEFTYLAPAAAGRTWYPYSFLAPREQNEPGLSSGLAVIASLIDELTKRGISKRRIVLMGFSQGACLTSQFALEHPARYGGIVIFSGGVIGPLGTRFSVPAVGFEGTPAFFGCSDVDAHVPKVRVEESAALFTAMGATVTSRIYPGMGHLVNDDEVRAAQKVLDAVMKEGIA